MDASCHIFFKAEDDRWRWWSKTGSRSSITDYMFLLHQGGLLFLSLFLMWQFTCRQMFFSTVTESWMLPRREYKTGLGINVFGGRSSPSQKREVSPINHGLRERCAKPRVKWTFPFAILSARKRSTVMAIILLVHCCGSQKGLPDLLLKPEAYIFPLPRTGKSEMGKEIRGCDSMLTGDWLHATKWLTVYKPCSRTCEIGMRLRSMLWKAYFRVQRVISSCTTSRTQHLDIRMECCCSKITFVMVLPPVNVISKTILYNHKLKNGWLIQIFFIWYILKVHLFFQ